MNHHTRKERPTADALALAAAYAAIWNEPDAERRHEAVRELGAPDAVHVFQPPEEVRTAAAQLDVTPVFQSRVGDAIKFGWEMVARSGEVAGVGLEFVVLDAEGRIFLDYQLFIEG